MRDEVAGEIGKELFTKIYEKFGIKFHFVGMENTSKISSFINKNTKKSDIILISVTADYLKMIAQDLKLLNKKYFFIVLLI